MSADILAAFGTLEVGASESPVKAKQTDENQKIRSDVLIPDLSVDGGHAAHSKDSVVESKRTLFSESGGEVLFDASVDGLDQEDEFGDFEQADHGFEQGASGPGTTEPLQPSQAPKVQQTNLLDLNHDSELYGQVGERIKSPPKPSDTDLNLSKSLTRSAESDTDILIPPHHDHKPTAEETPTEDDWAPFEDGQETALDFDGAVDESKQISSTSNATAPVASSDVRPNNIPPPVILLQVLPKVFSDLSNDCRKDNPDQLSMVLQVHKVAGYLIAGRSLRWKRDNLLSQNMRIGPATTGKGGGMKLMSIDKNESLKEEREISEVLRVWQQYSHRFNRLLSHSSSKRPPMALSESLRIRATERIGTIDSSHPCALCGLRREERVSGVDFQVNDSFGEFWIAHWGHKDCRDFWNRSQGLLQTRGTI